MRPARTINLASCTLGLTLALGCAPAPRSAAPGDRGVPDGLEVLCWVVDSSLPAGEGYETIGEALSAHEARPVPLDGAPGLRDAWRANGLRMTSVPTADLDLLRAKLPTVGPAQEQWFGTLARWTPLSTGPAFDESWRLALDNGTIDLPAGSIRLLGRAWIVPVEPEARDAPMRAQVRVELVVQHAEAASRRDLLEQSYGLSAKPAAEEAGVLFSRLGAGLTMREGEAIVITTEAPEVEWKPREARSEEAPTTAQGPIPMATPTLGEALLSDGKGTRLVLILVARAPERYHLLGQ